MQYISMLKPLIMQKYAETKCRQYLQVIMIRKDY